MNEVANLSIQIRAFTRLPDNCEEKESLIQQYYGEYLKYKHVQLEAEKYDIARAVRNERPDFLQLSPDEKKLLILRCTIGNELSRKPQDMVALAVFVHEWWNLKLQVATAETDRRYPNLSPEERLANIHVFVQEGDPNP
jgi:hypothetical protein